MRRLALGSCFFLFACGGKVVVDDRGGQGGAGTSSSAGISVTTGPSVTVTASATTTTTTTVASTTSVSTGPGPCTAHEECPGGVCVFSTGACAPDCGFDFCAGCGPGMVCDECATSSCPSCADCRAACVPAGPERCDDDDPCPPDRVCDFYAQLCVPVCDADADCGGFAYCEPCLSGSCCGCDDCVSGCLGGE